MTSTNSNRAKAAPDVADVAPHAIRVAKHYASFAASRSATGYSTHRLEFADIDGRDVYNVTAPFVVGRVSVIAGRVEARDDEHSTIVFFHEIGGVWKPIAGAPVFDLQDPFITFVRGELVFGGVRIYQKDDGRLGWKTVFFRGSGIFDLREFFVGPNGMKDIRLCDLRNGRIAIFTRPQGLKGGRGTIGYAEISDLDELSLAVIEEAPLITGMFDAFDWGGANETHLLANGEIGVLAHAAYHENDDVLQARHYYATAFTFDRDSRSVRNYRVIASREQFPDGPSKRPDLKDVIFPTGLIRDGDGSRLYAGLSDAEAYWINIPDPFRA